MLKQLVALIRNKFPDCVFLPDDLKTHVLWYSKNMKKETKDSSEKINKQELMSPVKSVVKAVESPTKQDVNSAVNLRDTSKSGTVRSKSSPVASKNSSVTKVNSKINQLRDTNSKQKVELTSVTNSPKVINSELLKVVTKSSNEVIPSPNEKHSKKNENVQVSSAVKVKSSTKPKLSSERNENAVDVTSNIPIEQGSNNLNIEQVSLENSKIGSNGGDKNLVDTSEESRKKYGIMPLADVNLFACYWDLSTWFPDSTKNKQKEKPLSPVFVSNNRSSNSNKAVTPKIDGPFEFVGKSKNENSGFLKRKLIENKEYAGLDNDEISSSDNEVGPNRKKSTSRLNKLSNKAHRKIISDETRPIRESSRNRNVNYYVPASDDNYF